jgi:copper chaperone
VITQTISVPEIHCDHCKSSIEGALTPLEGVAEAVVNIDAATVTVRFDDRVVGRDEVIKAIEAQGYDVPA